MRCSDYLKFSIAILRTIAIFRDVTNNEANAKGETMSKNQQISFVILELVRTGMELRQAFDTVLGVGAYDKLAGELYDSLRS
jgi:hypothetical protein